MEPKLENVEIPFLFKTNRSEKNSGSKRRIRVCKNSEVCALYQTYLTGAVGDQMEDCGPADWFAVRRGAPAVAGLVVTLHGQEVTVRVALRYKDGGSRSHRAAAAGAGLQSMSPSLLALGLTWV